MGLWRVGLGLNTGVLVLQCCSSFVAMEHIGLLLLLVL